MHWNQRVQFYTAVLVKMEVTTKNERKMIIPVAIVGTKWKKRANI